MILLLDQGNSRLKWMLCPADGWRPRAQGAAHDLAGALPDIHRALPGAAVADILLSSVATREATARLIRDCVSAFGCAPRELRATAVCSGLYSGYDDPALLGADRWFAMLGAWAEGIPSFVVMDAGTAITIDVVREGRHLGGYILPGLAMQRAALGLGTARVGVAAGCAAPGWGRNTAAGVLNGTAQAVAALASASLIELQGTVADTCPLLLTGGSTPELLPLLQGARLLVRDDLVFRGMVAQWGADAARG